MPKNILTQSRLKELLHYNPETGVFTRVKNNKPTGWLDNGYVKIHVAGADRYAHRLAWLYMAGRVPLEVDHDNHNKADNRWDNLNGVDRQGNKRNGPKQANNTSGVTGVYRQAGKWRVRIKVDGKFKSLGYFGTVGEAVTARKDADRKYGFHVNHGK